MIAGALEIVERWKNCLLVHDGEIVLKVRDVGMASCDIK